MRIERRFTKTGQSPYAEIEFRKALSEIRNPDGSVVFRLDDIDVPAQFSQVAADILAQKYFRKAGVPVRLRKIEENDVPSFLWRSVPTRPSWQAACRRIPQGAVSEIKNPGRLGRLPARRHRRAGAVLARSRPTSSPRSISARPACRRA